jgi:hypothetical protein
MEFTLITSGIAAAQSTGGTLWTPNFLSYLASAYAELGQFDEAWRCIGEAMAHVETTKEMRWEAEVNRIAGEIALTSSQQGEAAAEGCFERAVSIARKQQANSLELRAATSMARLWRDQGKTTASPRSSRPGLRLVQGGLRHGRLVGREGAVGAAQSMSEVRKWLEGIGLGEYGDAFEANKIDMDLLGEVDDQILKEIGMSAAGDRLRIRKAIAKLATAPVTEVNLGPTTPKTTAASAERRQLTVMFCDLVGSTACRLGSTPRTCGASLAPITAAARNWSSAMVASSPSIW